jgi:dTMP kinase
MFISIEGPDQAGKTTQIELLKSFAFDNSLDWLFTRNPGATDLGKDIRDIVLDNKRNICDYAELLLYLADRAQHIEEVLKPAKEKQSVVICDRYFDSTIAYQGFGRELDVNFIKQVNSFICKDHKPDLTILLMLTPTEAFKRRQGIADRLEQENKLFHIRVLNGFKTMAASEPGRIKIINVADMSKEDVHARIIELIKAQAEDFGFNLNV